MLPRGLEPRTLRLLAVRSDQLSYKSCCNSHLENARFELTKFLSAVGISPHGMLSYGLSAVAPMV